MTRNHRRRAAACLCAGLVTLLLAPTTSVRAAEEVPEETDPLLVTIDRVGPSVIPDRGRIRLSGAITNTTDSTWTDLKVYLLTSFEPMRTEAELAEADALDPDAYVGDRLAQPGQFISVPDLAPGESTRYVISRPRDELTITGQPGVYWVGVQVLGADENGRVDGADGRARTLVPLMRVRNPPSATLALTLPFRARMAYDEDGRVLTEDEWHGALSEHGRFGRLLALSRSAGSFPLTWVVDPAFVDLLRALAADNPGFDIGPSDGTGSPSPTTTEEPDEGAEPPPLSPEAEAAAQYLVDFTAEAADRDVLSLPYGDVDVAGAYTWTAGGIVEDALELAESTLAGIDVDSTPVVDPPDGTAPWAALEGLPIEVPVLLDDIAVDGASTRVDVTGGPRITQVDTTAVPETGNALDVRQRILAETAVRALSRASGQPLVVQLPDRWDPGARWQRAQFFRGLDVPWLVGTETSTVTRATTLDSIEQRSDALHYPEDDPALPTANFLASDDLLESGHVLDVLLPRNDTVGQAVAGMAYLGVSSQFREVPGRAQDRTDDLDNALRGLMDKVTLSGPTFVTMSSENGEFQVTIVNGLDEPVSVGVEARVAGSDDIAIPPTDPITIPAGQRRSVRMKASTSRIGLWPVVLEPVNSAGDRIGGGEELNIRSSHVGQVVWAGLGVGTLVLLVLIVFRVRRRVRQRQATPGPLLKQEEA